MSDGVLALIGVALGGLLSPLTSGVGFLVRRHFEQSDQQRAERRQALVQLQEAILDLTRAEEAHESATDRLQVGRDIGTAKRRIRLLAAQVGDDRLWTLVNTPHPDRMQEVYEMGKYGEPGDIYDEWNDRIRELFAESGA